MKGGITGKSVAETAISAAVEDGVNVSPSGRGQAFMIDS